MDDISSRYLGAVGLVVGSCIGSGMLAMPAVTAPAGFFPSFAALLFAATFMLLNGIVLAEVKSWFPEHVGIIGMSKQLLGPLAANVATFLYGITFYCLIVAFICESDSFIMQSVPNLPPFTGGFITTLGFSLLCLGGTRLADLINRPFMVAMGVSFIFLIFQTLCHISSENISYSEPIHALRSLPILLIGFGFHNLVPTLCDYVKEKRLVHKSLVTGTLITLTVYVLFELAVLGNISVHQSVDLNDGDTVALALTQIASSPSTLTSIHIFAFCALITTFIGVALGFIDFLADGLDVKKTLKGRALLSLIVMGPPFLFSLVYPRIFLVALGYVGGIAVVVLFGIFPCLMYLKGRKTYKDELELCMPIIGGLLGSALFVMGLELFYEYVRLQEVL